MAYETNTYSSATDLVNKLATFVEANGWTRDSLADEATGRRYHAHNGSVYLNMRALVNETAPSSASLQEGGSANVYSVGFNIGTGYSGGSPWYGQAGTPQNSTSKYRTVGLNNINAGGTYHFFAENGGDQIIVVVEYASGFYQRLSFGEIIKYGTWTGGPYMSGSTDGVQASINSVPFGFFRGPHGGQETSSGMGDVYALIDVDVDAETGWHWSSNADYGAARRMIRDYNNLWAYAAQNANQPNTLNDLAVLFPVVAYVNRSTSDDATVMVTPLGELPGVFYCTLARFVPGQQITFGSENYRVFPFWRKNSVAALPSLGSGHSGWYGFAVKE